MMAHYAKPMSCVRFRTLARMQLPLMLAVAATLFVAWPADAAEHPCGAPAAIERGDKLRLLRVWACGYSNDAGVSERALIKMITYRKLSNGDWYPVTSKSITLHSATLCELFGDCISFGQSEAKDCRHGSPGGPIGCSVPNTHRVTFYSPAWNVDAKDEMRTDVGIVSWRDDQGFPHADIQVSVQSPTWDAK
jgi:hypothetical protein